MYSIFFKILWENYNPNSVKHLVVKALTAPKARNKIVLVLKSRSQTTFKCNMDINLKKMYLKIVFIYQTNN